MNRFDYAFCQHVFYITRKAVDMETGGLIKISDQTELFLAVMDLAQEFYNQHDSMFYDGDNYIEDVELFAEENLQDLFGITPKQTL